MEIVVPLNLFMYLQKQSGNAFPYFEIILSVNKKTFELCSFKNQYILYLTLHF